MFSSWEKERGKKEKKGARKRTQDAARFALRRSKKESKKEEGERKRTQLGRSSIRLESGFPYEKDQWISISATSWATAALAPAMPVK
jgi:hypothetical protein